jgi:hypothetical protein
MIPAADSNETLTEDPAMIMIRERRGDEAMQWAIAQVSEARQAEEDGDHWEASCSSQSAALKKH